MELRHLQYFVTVARTLNFTRAAESLNLAQPAISKQIADLEREIGTSLFARNKRGVAMTAAGESFLVEAEKILSLIEPAKERARCAARGQTGKLSIGFFAAPTTRFLPELISQYRRDYPKIDIELHEINPGDQPKAFASGQIDVSFNRPLTIASEPRYKKIELFKEDLKVAMPAYHRLADRKTIPLQCLQNEHMVLLSREQAVGLYDTIISACSQHQVSLNIVANPSNMSTLTMFVASGAGIAIVPEGVSNINSHNLVFIGTKPKLPSVSLELQWLDSNKQPALKAFIDLVLKSQSKIKGHMYSS